MPLVVKSGTAIDEALKLRGMRPKDIDKVLLVGGTSKIPLVRRFVTEKLAGKEPEPFDKVDPMTCVAQGAAIVSAILAGGARVWTTTPTASSSSIRCAPTRSTSAGRSISIRSSSAAPTFPARSPRRTTPWPTRPSAWSSASYEGDVYDDPESPENVKLAEIPWEFKPPRPQRDGALDVTFEYGDDGILTVQIHDPHNGQKKRFAIQQSGEDQLDAAQIMQDEADQRGPGRRAASDLENTPEYRDALEVLKKTEQDVIPQGGECRRQARAGGAVPAGARGDGLGR